MWEAVRQAWREWRGLDGLSLTLMSTGQLLDRVNDAERRHAKLGDDIKTMRAELEGRENYNQPQPKLF